MLPMLLFWRRRKDVQDMDQDVLELDNQIHKLIDDLGPFLLSGTGLSGLGLGPAVQMNGGSTMMPSMNEVTPTMKHINMWNAVSSNSTTTKMDGIGGRNNGVDDAEMDIPSLDPAHLSIPTGLENTDFDFDSSTSTSDSKTRTTMTNAANASSAVNPLSVKPSAIDSTRDINGYIRLFLLPSHLFRVLRNRRHRLPLLRRIRVG